MATTFQKRQKEMKRLEKRQEKAAKKLARKEQNRNSAGEQTQFQPIQPGQHPESSV